MNEKMDILDRSEVIRRSYEIFRKLKKLDSFNYAENICCYISKDKEVDTHDIIRLIIEKKGKVFVPFLDNGIKISELRDFDNLKKGELGILEPEKKVIFEEEMDLMTVTVN